MVARSASCEADVLNALRLCVRDKRTNGLAVYLFKSGKNSGLLSDFLFKIDHNKTPYAAQAEKIKSTVFVGTPAMSHKRTEYIIIHCTVNCKVMS